MADPTFDSAAFGGDPAFGDVAANGDELSKTFDRLSLQTRDLQIGANGFARAMTSAFTSSVVQGKQFDDVLKALVLRMSDATLRGALAPVTRGFSNLLSGLFGDVSGNALGAIKPFASGGVINAPSYFPLATGVGLAGEAGPEAIMPLARGPDGRLGVAAASSGANVTIHIATPDVESFRRSEVYLTGQIARAVARGQRGL
jgi:phage-related minor tail protein